MKKLVKPFLAVVTLACLFMLSACGGSKWPTSYTFNGQLTSDTGAADVVLTLKEDKTLSMEASIGGALSGKWGGSWKQNNDGTVTVTFASAESEALDPPPAFALTLNDAETDLGGMGGLEVTSTIKDKTNTVTVLVNVAIGDGYTMTFKGALTQAAS